MTRTTKPLVGFFEGLERRRKVAELKPSKGTMRFWHMYLAKWQARYGREPPKANKREMICAAELWEMLSRDMRKAEAVLDSFFATADPFYDGHSIRLFRAHIDRFLVKQSFVASKRSCTIAAKRIEDLREAAGVRVEIEHLAAIVEDARQWARRMAERLCVNDGASDDEWTTSSTVRHPLWEVIGPGSPGVGPRYADWIVAEVSRWPTWDGGLGPFAVGRRQWRRFLWALCRDCGWRPSRREWSVMCEKEQH